MLIYNQVEAMTCEHIQKAEKSLKLPRSDQTIQKEQCTQCFEDHDSNEGIDVFLDTFNGACVGAPHSHARRYSEDTGFALALNIQRKLKVKPEGIISSEEGPPLKKLAIQAEKEEDKYEYERKLRCWACDAGALQDIPEGPIKSICDAISNSMTTSSREEVKAWEHQIEGCEHSVSVPTTRAEHQPDFKTDSHCKLCELSENLWICLACGDLGCGREQFGGLGGNSHAMAHFEITGHPIAAKLGTITAEGTADVFCYACKEERIDPNLIEDLAHFNINMANQVKTEKSMTELQIEHNLNYDFRMTDQDGQTLDPVFGPSLTGLSNLGNSCYMASILQSVFCFPSFQTRYMTAFLTHVSKPFGFPAEDLETQMGKIADGLLSGRYSHADSVNSSKFQKGIKPYMLKSLVGKGHAEFATSRQQDAEEFFGHLMDKLRKDHKKRGAPSQEDVSRIFSFQMEQRLQCDKCKKVRYSESVHDVLALPLPSILKKTEDSVSTSVQYESVELSKCLQMVTGPESIQYHCPHCQEDITAFKSQKFSSFPEVLVVHARRFQFVNWVPTKLEIPLVLPEEILLDTYISKGVQPGEESLPDINVESKNETIVFNEASMTALKEMGFSDIRSQKALMATGNSSDSSAAMEWLFLHMDDPDIDSPIKTTTSSDQPSQNLVNSICEMGFTAEQAAKALRVTNNDVERAMDWLFSHPEDSLVEEVEDNPVGSKELPARYRLKAFVSHKGPSVHSGHYVAHVLTDEHGWVLFNDEKVVRQPDVSEMKERAYLYYFEKILNN